MGLYSTSYEIGLFSGLNSKLILLAKVGLILINKWAKFTYFYLQSGPNSNGPKFFLHF